MDKSGPNKAKDRREIPNDLNISDFLRRAVAEARRVIAEIDQAETKFSEPEPV
jgi:hypothetical protein